VKEALGSSETSVLTRASVISQKTLFFIGHSKSVVTMSCLH
jgi:hypothetical protein